MSVEGKESKAWEEAIATSKSPNGPPHEETEVRLFCSEEITPFSRETRFSCCRRLSSSAASPAPAASFSRCC
jgi:hypothetical protein